MNLGYAANVGGSSEVYLPCQRYLSHFFGCLRHDFLDACVDDVSFGGALQQLFLIDAQSCSLVDNIQQVIFCFLLPTTRHTTRTHVLQVLQPLEIADCHSASIAQHIRQEFYAFCETDLLALESGRAVGSFNHHFALEEMGVDAIDGHL